MFPCVRITRNLPPHSLVALSPTPLRSHITTAFRSRFTPLVQYSSSSRRTYPRISVSTRAYQVQTSGSGLYTTAVVVGLTIGGVLLYPFVTNNTPEQQREAKDTSSTFDYSTLTESYLVMAPNTPTGRPGTLTPEQEDKLRELWTVTMKVFGVYESAGSAEEDIAETRPSMETETVGKDGKKEKKKSRLNVFKRKDKGDKSSGTTGASGSSTPSDISSLSIADDDDKHGQTKEFKAALANMAPEDLRKAFWSMVKHDHPDGLLLRFLRARKWDVEKALVMMVSTMHWRLEEMHVDDDIVRRGELGALEDSKSSDAKVKKAGEDFMAQMAMGKSYLHGLDKEGRPMCFVRVRVHKQGEQSEESIERFTVYTIETARMLLRPPIDTATIVFDMSSFSMANMDYAPVKFMIKCFEANYPESLGTVLVYRAPWIFNTVWSLIRGWLDPVVASKVHFCKTIDELEGFVPKSQIPAECGGDEKWEYSYVPPTEGENALLKDEKTREELQARRSEMVKKYESTILDWIHKPEAKSMDDRRRDRDTVAEELRQNYWTMDPYVRARTLYDRVGTIQEGGKLSFYGAPAAKEGVPTKAASVAEETHPDLD